MFISYHDTVGGGLRPDPPIGPTAIGGYTLSYSSLNLHPMKIYEECRLGYGDLSCYNLATSVLDSAVQTLPGNRSPLHCLHPPTLIKTIPRFVL